MMTVMGIAKLNVIYIPPVTFFQSFIHSPSICARGELSLDGIQCVFSITVTAIIENEIWG